uniref:Uncharacterized protein LOC111134456 n=1 Tax=Crassostrea virginica TaxID=6565 RepID=A0A8B8EHR2_CRAVI|nr:uncharacterized protein LOC111134456 [Crassostrea virginica]
MGRFAVFLLVYVLCGLVLKSYAQEAYNYDDEDYDDDYYDEEPTATVIPKRKVLEIENATQHVVIRLIHRENRLMSKNLDDATERCTKETAIFEESCQKCVKEPKFLKTVLKEAEKLLKLHSFYLPIKMGKKVLKTLKRIRVRRIVKNVGKTFRRVGETIGKTWKSINRNVRRTLRKIKGAVRVRVRRLVRVRVRLPRVRLPRVRVRLPRVRVPRVRVRVRVGRRWGKKKKRSSCSDCERISNIKDEETLSKTLCPYLFSVNEESLKTDAFLQKFISEIESGFPKLGKILHHHYLSSDEAEVTIATKEGSHSYKVKNFSKLSSEQLGRTIGRYIFKKAKGKA